MCKRGLSAWQPLACPPQCSGVCLRVLQWVYDVWQRVWRVQMAGVREKRRWEGGERCVVALIWSAILVSTNQGLPVPRGA